MTNLGQDPGRGTSVEELALSVAMSVEHFLLLTAVGGLSSTEGSTMLTWVGLYEKADCEPGIKPISSTPPCSLPQFLPLSSCLESLPWLPFMTDYNL